MKYFTLTEYNNSYKKNYCLFQNSLSSQSAIVQASNNAHGILTQTPPNIMTLLTFTGVTDPKLHTYNVPQNSLSYLYISFTGCAPPVAAC